MVGRPKKEDARLDVALIVNTAWELVDREGVDALSTRALATALNVKGPALYWHVPSMQDLHSLMVERMLSETIGSPAPGEQWDDWLLRTGLEQRRNFLKHRDSGRIIAGAPPTDRIRNEVMPTLIGPLLLAGFEREEAIAAAGGFASFILGWVIYEQSEAVNRYIASMVEPNAAFAFGLSAFVAGLKTKVP